MGQDKRDRCIVKLRGGHSIVLHEKVSEVVRQLEDTDESFDFVWLQDDEYEPNRIAVKHRDVVAVIHVSRGK